MEKKLFFIACAWVVQACGGQSKSESNQSLPVTGSAAITESSLGLQEAIDEFLPGCAAKGEGIASLDGFWMNTRGRSSDRIPQVFLCGNKALGLRLSPDSPSSGETAPRGDIGTDEVKVEFLTYTLEQHPDGQAIRDTEFGMDFKFKRERTTCARVADTEDGALRFTWSPLDTRFTMSFGNVVFARASAEAVENLNRIKFKVKSC